MPFLIINCNLNVYLVYNYVYYTIINVTTMCNYVYIMLISVNFVFLLSTKFSFKIRLNCQNLYISKNCPISQ